MARARLPWRPPAGIRPSRAILACILLTTGSPAIAQWSGSVTLASQARLRGRPISDHWPVAELELVHDDRRGFYVGGPASVVVGTKPSIQPLSLTQYADFARSLPRGLAIDMASFTAAMPNIQGPGTTAAIPKPMSA